MAVGGGLNDTHLQSCIFHDEGQILYSGAFCLFFVLAPVLRRLKLGTVMSTFQSFIFRDSIDTRGSMLSANYKTCLRLWLRGIVRIMGAWEIMTRGVLAKLRSAAEFAF